MYDISKLILIKDTLLQKRWRKRIRDYSFLIGESAADFGLNLVIMIIIERTIGPSGLGIFAYLLSVLVFADFLSDFGISEYLEREIAFSPNNENQTQTIENAFYAISVTSIAVSIFFFLTAVTDTTHTTVNEKVIAYFIIGITLPIRNSNRIRIAVLQGLGKFETASKLKTWKRFYLFGATMFFLILRLPPSLLMLGFLVAEIGLLVRARKLVRLPRLRTRWDKGWHPIRFILTQSHHYLLSEDVLDVVLYLDFFLLGLFVSSEHLGFYAEASILARFFLVIPISIKPIFRNRYCTLIAENQIQKTALYFNRMTAYLFSFHAILALYILLYYPCIMECLYQSHEQNLVPFYIFVEILPGLLFFSAITSHEPLYEAEDKMITLQKIVIFTALLNLVLNSFFIPFSGYYGAAFATSAAMFGYFIFFGHHLTWTLNVSKLKYLSAGAGVYLTFMLFNKLKLSSLLTFFLMPLFLLFLFYAIGIYNFKTDQNTIKGGK